MPRKHNLMGWFHIVRMCARESASVRTLKLNRLFHSMRSRSSRFVPWQKTFRIFTVCWTFLWHEKKNQAFTIELQYTISMVVAFLELELELFSCSSRYIAAFVDLNVCVLFLFLFTMFSFVCFYFICPDHNIDSNGCCLLEHVFVSWISEWMSIFFSLLVVSYSLLLLLLCFSFWLFLSQFSKIVCIILSSSVIHSVVSSILQCWAHPHALA